MRYVEGTDLATLLTRDGRLGARFAADITRQVAAALDAAHRRGLIHRDVKPANILLAEQDGQPHAYLTDFGIAKDSAATLGLTSTGEWMGTLDYVAPEQFVPGTVDARADIYSLACVLYQMLAGRVPYGGSGMEKMWAHANQPPPSLGLGAGEAGLDQVIAQGMAKEPAKRYQSAGDLGRAAVAAAAKDAVPRLQGSVATGAAATGSDDSLGPTRPLHLRTLGREQARKTDTQAPTRILRGAVAHTRRLLMVAGGALLVALGAAAGLVLTQQGTDADAPITTVTEAAEEIARPAETTAETVGTRTPERGRSRRKARAPDAKAATPPATPQPPVRPPGYTSFAPSISGYHAEVPSGPGWSAPSETEPTPGRLYRATVRGPGGFVLLIDYTPSEPAGFGAGHDSVQELPHPYVGSMTEYIFSGGSIPECASTTCVDYIINGSTSGYAVLAGGSSDFTVAREVAHHVAQTLMPD